jgi:hypothetical protein
MNEPLRWLEDPDTPSRLAEVLEAAPTAPPMPAEQQVRLGIYAAGLLSSGVAVKTAAAAVGAKSTAAILGGTSVVKAVALMAAAGVVGYSVVGFQLGTPASVRDVVQGQAASVPTMVLRPSNVANAEDPSEERATPPTPEGPPQLAIPSSAAKSLAQHPAAAASAAAAAAEFEEPSIADEAKLLELARSQLVQEPARALETAHRHQLVHPDGQLGAERELIAVEALLRLGRQKEAELRAAPRLEQAPESLYARRLRKLLREGVR